METNEKGQEVKSSLSNENEEDLVFPGWLRKYGIDPDKKVQYMEWIVDSESIVE